MVISQASSFQDACAIFPTPFYGFKKREYEGERGESVLPDVENYAYCTNEKK